MSYHNQNNVQQRSLGFFFVVAFHALLIAGLVSGLGSGFIPSATKPNVITIIQNKIIPPPLPIPIEPTVQQTDPNIINLPIIQNTPHFEFPPEKIIPFTTMPDPIINTVSSITKPKLVKASKPDYPLVSTRLGEEGTTGLRLLITEQGRVTDVQLLSTSGSDRLDMAAIKHAQHNWAFTPCTEGGKAVACWFDAKLVWRLEKSMR